MEFCCFGKICSAKYSATFTGCYVVAESCTKTWSGQPHAMRRKLSNFVSLPFPRITFHRAPGDFINLQRSKVPALVILAVGWGRTAKTRKRRTSV